MSKPCRCITIIPDRVDASRCKVHGPDSVIVLDLGAEILAQLDFTIASYGDFDCDEVRIARALRLQVGKHEKSESGNCLECRGSYGDGVDFPCDFINEIHRDLKGSQ